ncbi:MAG: hypothetical protein DMG38_00045 [Acidobacteria bacterium]|nr:MAG: hypothetical protein DMG38_00045 [Acidobacteriota bacterium]
MCQTLLRKSLDDVCRLQKRQLAGFILLFFSEIGCILWLGRISEIHPLDIPKMVVAAMFFVLVSMVYVAMALAWLLSCMTKKVLSAIKLASKT